MDGIEILFDDVHAVCIDDGQCFRQGCDNVKSITWVVIAGQPWLVVFDEDDKPRFINAARVDEVVFDRGVDIWR